ncbi:MAG TPA: DinB family protein [Cyclobacteriaceae bacterium]|nr:DinB family protein [Cyclobacteriaceae bacterium]
MTPIEICLLQWKTYNTRTQKMLDAMSTQNFNTPIVPSGNSPSWLFGHLADTDDKLLELFGIRSRLFPELEEIYHHDRGTNQTGHLSKEELTTKWKSISAELDRTFNAWTEKDWMSRHTAVSEEDFIKEPHRNKLNVMLGRVEHKASHLGQIAMLPKV